MQENKDPKIHDMDRFKVDPRSTLVDIGKYFQAHDSTQGELKKSLFLNIDHFFV